MDSGRYPAITATAGPRARHVLLCNGQPLTTRSSLAITYRPLTRATTVGNRLTATDPVDGVSYCYNSLRGGSILQVAPAESC